IRDSETASLAVQAALTGHLVFSTLHTNSAAGILPRLLDMGIEPFLLASTLNVVIGQRLVRRITEKRELYKSNEIETKSINEIVGKLLPKDKESVAKIAEDLGYPGLPVKSDDSYMLARGINSKETPGGYKGRTGLFETIEVDDDIQKMLVSHSTASDIMKLAKSKGTVTMRQDGILKVLSGITSIEEVNRVASDIA
ncbi:MAG: ATPase, T2SS/T4P/T4SS family, partial [Pseudomonadota bacterium]|nr:ATPase, T2SS/T4P/T4SS family [Pseudomonadota bacterium]